MSRLGEAKESSTQPRELERPAPNLLSPPPTPQKRSLKAQGELNLMDILDQTRSSPLK